MEPRVTQAPGPAPGVPTLFLSSQATSPPGERQQPAVQAVRNQSVVIESPGGGVSLAARTTRTHFSNARLRQSNCSADTQSEVETMLVAGGLGVLVVICLLLAMMETPPHIGG